MEQQPLFDEIKQHVNKLPIVQQLIEKLNDSKLLPLHLEYSQAFCEAPAATTMHHNFTHGLLIHTAEVWQAAQAFMAHAPKNAAWDIQLKEDVDAVETGKQDQHRYWFNDDELFTVVYLHDFAKIKQYEPAGDFSWKKVKMVCNQECWTLRELAKHGIDLTDNELVGLLHAEGGYTEFDVDWRPISAIMHAADLWSSQAMRTFWDIAKETDLRCKFCGQPMRAINGANGTFYGCTGYPGCKSTMNANEVPPAEAVFLKFLQKNYPLPA